VRLWNRAEAAVSLMGEFLHDLELEAPPLPGRVAAAGVPAPEFDEFDEVQYHWAHDEAAFAELLASARAFAIRESVDFDGPVAAYLDAMVEWLKVKAPKGLRTMGRQSPMAGCAADARRKVGAGKL
jgi:hypothetical protein